MMRYALAVALAAAGAAFAAPVKMDYYLEGVDPGVRIFVRQKMVSPTATSRRSGTNFMPSMRTV